MDLALHFITICGQGRWGSKGSIEEPIVWIGVKVSPARLPHEGMEVAPPQYITGFWG